MPANIEIKAVLRDRRSLERVAATLTDHLPEVLHQEDTFFRCESGRLKLRVLGPRNGELIHYHRADQAGPRISHYTIARSENPDELLQILTSTLGRVGTVKKTRTLYLIGQTRLHLDQVEGLGEFLELEVVLKPGQAESEGNAIAEELLAKFHIKSTDLIPIPYIDLLLSKVHDGVAIAEQGKYNSPQGHRP